MLVSVSECVCVRVYAFVSVLIVSTHLDGNCANLKLVYRFQQQ